MTKTPHPSEPSPFDCRARRHKVLAGDGICVLCGRRGVVDARLLPDAAPATQGRPTMLDAEQ